MKEDVVEPWSFYQKLVITELQRLNDSAESMRDNISVMKTEIQILKVKSSIWGSIGGGLTVFVALVVEWFTKNK